MTVAPSTPPPAIATDVAFRAGHIKDEWARLIEPAHRRAEGRAFLWTGRRAEVGQRTETQVTVDGGGGAAWCRLSGVVTDVGVMPTLDEWRDGGSCRLPPGVRDGTLPPGEQLSLREDFVGYLGTLHGQTVTSYSFLDVDFLDRQGDLPFKRAGVYRVTHAADENRSFLWCVTRIEDVSHLPFGDLPEAFRKWARGSRAARVSF